MFQYCKVIVSLLLLSFLSRTSNSQTYSKNNPVIDKNAIDNWLTNDQNGIISNNGEYFAYTFYKGDYRKKSEITLRIMSVNSEWKRDFMISSPFDPFFSKDGKTLIFLNSDTFCLFNLKTKILNKISDVSEIQFPKEDNREWIVYKVKSLKPTFVLFNITKETKVVYDSVDNVLFSNNGKVLILQGMRSNDNGKKCFLSWVNLHDLKRTDLWNGKSGVNDEQVTSLYIDEEKLQMTFMVEYDSIKNSQLNQPSYSIWYFKEGMNSAILKVSNNSPGVEPGLCISNYPAEISNGNGSILFKLQASVLREKSESAASVDVWNYKDEVLQSKQLMLATVRETYIATISINGDKVIRLSNENEQIVSAAHKTEYFVVTGNTNVDRFWNKKTRKNWLVSLKDGSKISLPSGINNYYFSPDDQFLLYYNLSDHNYYSYNILTKTITDLTSNLKTTTFSFADSGVVTGLTKLVEQAPVGVAGWLKNESSVLVYDNYDLWQLNLSGVGKPRNITDGFGAKNRIKLRLLETELLPVFNGNETVLMTGYNEANKDNGFYKTVLNKPTQPRLIFMGPYAYDFGPYVLIGSSHNFGSGFIPLKAKDASVWVVGRQSSTESFNYYVTSDFKTYKALTDIQPQLDYNWLTAELISWKQLDGTTTKGVLYKPKSFDPQKKYPVIINYYMQFSHRLNQFPQPGFTQENINIPWFVSRDYIILTPDIIFRNSEVGESACNTVVSAAQMLAKFPFVDTSKIAINGHSIGGWLTNYIITHTGMFAAATEAAGMTDNISAALQLSGKNYNILRIEDAEQRNSGVSIWEKPEWYTERNPILKVDKIKTPLLIMHNKADGSVPWVQAVELFIALWRMEKPVWMLQYDNSDHVLSMGNDTKDAEDYTVRLTQFFDHFLKDKPAPKWMTHGLPAKLKQIESGYELDSTGQCHKNCKVCSKNNEFASEGEQNK